ncbi:MULTISPECIES: PDDEXK family nuclease [Bacillus cereus group]|uniref:DUF2726 domain-containing protein n=2 Tax=Bacillus cereus group TaxID=86661 RepID=A0AAN0SSH7_BACCE|nr:hypothetical protein [Bacillus cereus]HDR7254985.1 hypothetical protein [Bacillus pacificus]HDR7765503.1 hypothetical protein [Bacillus paranthracis]AJI08873.1 hypothetical protein AK40_5688 [Bacillus cereus 03BB108]AJI11725.1 hypothetical protein AK40_285 [Bacillus cereus 03BB108]AJI12577.1 hypothetical protein AK40_2208 [Bacillus cereus 03BB108]
MKKKTHLEFLVEFEAILGPEYELLSEYAGSQKQVKVKHKVCDEIYEVTPDHILRKRKCPNCFGNKKKTTKQFIAELENNSPGQFEVIGEYLNSKTKMEIKHLKCGVTRLVWPNDILRNGGCRHCAGNEKKTTEQFKKEVFEQVGNEYTVRSKYLGSHKDITMYHLSCGKEYTVKPYNFINNRRRCPHCFRNIRKTTQQFKEKVYELVGYEYKVLGEYQGTDEKIEMLHTSCGNIYNATPYHFIHRHQRCPECFGNKKRTNEEFLEEIRNLTGNEYTFLEEYVNTNTPLNLIHNICEHVFKVRPTDFIHKASRCPKCKKNIKLTFEEFKNRVFDLVGDEYTPSGEYINSNTHLMMAHHVCNTIYPVTPAKFLSGRRCPTCFGKHQKSTKEFKEEVYDLVGDEYEVIGEYVNSQEKIMMRHNVCGCEYPVLPSMFLHRSRCPNCFGNEKKTTEQFKQEVYDLVGDEYSVIEEYSGASNYIRMKHNVCRHEYSIVAVSFLRGTRCAQCKESKGERLINQILADKGIKFQRQYKFDKCRHINPLPFDFAIFKDEQVAALIEFQGRQHYQPIDYFGGESAFAETQIRDEIKKDFCKKMDIPLFIIPHWEYESLEQLLQEKLTMLNF